MVWWVEWKISTHLLFNIFEERGVLINRNHKIIIGKTILQCLSKCNDIVAIYNLSNEHDIITHRSSLPIIPDIELLVITRSYESAERLYNNQKEVNELSMSYLLSKNNLICTKFLSLDEFTDLQMSKKLLLHLRIFKSTLIYENSNNSDNEFIVN